MPEISIQQFRPWNFDTRAMVDLVLTGVPVGPDTFSQYIATLQTDPNTQVVISGENLAYDGTGHVTSGIVNMILVHVDGKQVIYINYLALDVAAARLASPGTYPLEADPTYYYEGAGGPVDEDWGKFGFQFVGEGNGDHIIGSYGPDVLLGLGGNDWIVGMGGKDELYGGLGDDSLEGSRDGGLCDGGGGDDLIQGGAGNDTIRGGSGNDTLLAYDHNGWGRDRGRDKIYGGRGDDSIEAGSDRGFYDGGRGDDLLRGWTASDSMRGGVGDDTLFGGDGFDSLEGGSGNDALDGGGGDDFINGGDGNDEFSGGVGRDTMKGGVGFDAVDYSDIDKAVEVVLAGRDQVDVWIGDEVEDSISGIEAIFGGANSDLLIGDSMNNYFQGGDGDDLLDGLGGRDAVDYSDKSSSVRVTLSEERATTVRVGGLDEDRIRNFEDVIGGSAGDILTGDTLSNYLEGGAGRDTISGSGGADHLAGGVGHDVLRGGQGADFFYFFVTPADADSDRIKDFGVGHDKILLEHTVFLEIGKSLRKSEFRLGAVAQDSDDHLIYDRSSGKLYYDADGDGANVQNLIAIVSGAPAIGHGDFVIA
jgi:Ca2+-binding RTX toxin-like protein